MSISETILRARKQAGLTQEGLAAKVYVTRQAVSRWETGESEPGIDMRKLLAQALGLPVTELFDLPDTDSCQCCGAPFTIPDMEHGTNADGTESPDYCKWCYRDGEFAEADLDETIEFNAPYLMQATGYSREEVVSYLGALLPTLKRWRLQVNRNVAANLRKGLFHVCPTCHNIIWSSGEATVSCCHEVVEPLTPQKNADALDATVETTDGCQRVHIEHAMTKEDHLLFIAAVGDDLVRIKRLYPEQEARAEFNLQGPARIYAYGEGCGLVDISR